MLFGVRMSTALLLCLITLLLAMYLSFDLYSGRYYYLLNARNKSVEGYIQWWLGKNGLFLAITAGAYLLGILLSFLAEWYGLPFPLTAAAVCSLFLTALWLNREGAPRFPHCIDR
jgi:ABC-type Fe3+ transport system permease subunit